MNKVYSILKLAVLSIFFSVAYPFQGETQTIIPINDAQIFSDHNGEKLFDGNLETFLHAGWSLEDYPASTYVALGGSYNLTEIELYDFAGFGQFSVYAGSPNNWDNDPIVVDDLVNYKSWNSHTLNVTTSYLLFKMKTSDSKVSEIRIYGTASGDGSPTEQEITIDAPTSVTLIEGTTEIITVQATHTTTLSAENMPGFISFNDLGNGNGSFNVAPETGDAGIYDLTLNATSQNGQLTTSTTIKVTVEEAIPDDPGSGPTEGSEVRCEVLATKLIFGGGNPRDLVDEQDIIDNPADGTGGNPLTYWFPGWNSSNYPSEGYLDMGSTKTLTRIFLRDINGTGNFKIYAGAPGSWEDTPIVDDNLSGYLSWNEHPTPVSTRFLKVVMNDGNSNVSELAIYGYCGNEIPPVNNDQEISFNAPTAVTLAEGTTETVSVQAVNATNISAEDLPSFINFNDLGNGSGNFVIAPQAGDAGTYILNLNASHQNGQAASTTINVTVEAVDEPDPGPTGGEETLCEISTTQLIFGAGDPGNLVDEQDAIDDPANSPGGNPLNFWFPGWKSRYYPAEGYLDLGGTKTLTRIFLRDINGTGNFKIYAGAPGNWQNTPIVDDNLLAYLSWTEHTTPVTTRYLKVVMEDPSSKVAELAIYGYCGGDIIPDDIAPSQINDLSTSNAATQSIQLNWKASGDDGNSGTATTYDLRYSQNPITADNFSDAIAIATNVPQPTGSNETQTVTGLNCNTAYYFAIRVSDEAGNISSISNIASATTGSCGNQNGKQIVLTLNQTISSLNVSKSKLKYNKDFAYSFTVDDGNIWDYYIAFPVINGGESGFPPTNPATPWFEFPDDPHVQEAGFSYSDGCGNEVKFKAGLALNTKLATNTVTDYHITWDNIREVYDNDWDIFSHGHNHCNNSCNYHEEIQVNSDLLEDNLGFLPTHFVVPSGNESYHEVAFNNGMVAVYDQGYQLPGFQGLQVNETLNYNEFLMHRYPLEISEAPYGYDLDMIAGLAGNGNHYWMAEFSHAIGYSNGGEYHIRVEYQDFKDYMNYIENEYGKPWSDKKVWMAPMQEVHEYLRVRDAVNISSNIQGNALTIYVDDDEVPSGLRRHALSLIVDLPSGVNITEVVPSEVTIESYNSETGLLNLRWD